MGFAGSGRVVDDIISNEINGYLPGRGYHQPPSFTLLLVIRSSANFILWAMFVVYLESLWNRQLVALEFILAQAKCYWLCLLTSCVSMRMAFSLVSALVGASTPNNVPHILAVGSWCSVGPTTPNCCVVKIVFKMIPYRDEPICRALSILRRISQYPMQVWNALSVNILSLFLLKVF